MAFGRAYGFETLSVTTEAGFAATTSASNTVECIAGAARTGAGGIRITRGSAAGLVYFGIGNSSQPPTLLNAQMWYGMAIRFSALPSSDTVVVRIGSGTGVSGYILVNASGNLTCQIQGGSASATVATLTTSTWYWLEILHDVSGTTHTIQARVDQGTSQSANRTGQSATTSRFNIIGTDVAGGGTYTMDFDDLVIHSSQTAFLPTRRNVVRLRPDADVDSAWTITGGDGVNRWNSIDDLTPDDTTSYISSTTSGHVQRVHLSNYTLAAGETFEGVSVYGRVGSNGTTGTRTVAVNIRTTADANGTASTWAANVNGWQNNTVARDDANVPGGTGFSQSDMDGLGIRMVKSATTDAVRVSTVWAYVSVVEPKVVAVGQPSVTNTAQPVDRVKAKEIGQPSVTNTAQAIDPARVYAVGLPSTAETALPVTAIMDKVVAVGLVSETDSPLSIGPVKTLGVGQASETDTAQGSTTSSKAIPVGLVSETDTARTSATDKSHLLGVVTETDSSQAIAATAKAKEIGLASETDSASDVFRPGVVVAVEQASATNTALPITILKSRLVAQAIESDLSQALAPARLALLGESDVALPITAIKPRRRRRGRKSSSAAVLSNPRRWG